MSGKFGPNQYENQRTLVTLMTFFEKTIQLLLSLHNAIYLFYVSRIIAVDTYQKSIYHCIELIDQFSIQNPTNDTKNFLL